MSVFSGQDQYAKDRASCREIPFLQWIRKNEIDHSLCVIWLKRTLSDRISVTMPYIARYTPAKSLPPGA